MWVVCVQNATPDLKAKFAKVISVPVVLFGPETRMQFHSDVPATSCSNLENMEDISAHSIYCTLAHALPSIKQKHTLLHLYVLHFPTYKTPSFATFSFQGNASKEHICLWVIVRQRFMSCTQANAVSRLTPFWCQVNFALIKLLTKSVNDIYCLSVCLSYILALQFLFHPVSS